MWVVAETIPVGKESRSLCIHYKLNEIGVESGQCGVLFDLDSAQQYGSIAIYNSISQRWRLEMTKTQGRAKIKLDFFFRLLPFSFAFINYR